MAGEKSGGARKGWVQVRVSEEEIEAFKAAAGRRGLTVSEWVRRCAQEGAVDQLEEQVVIESDASTVPAIPTKKPAPSSSAAGSRLCENCKRKGDKVHRLGGCADPSCKE